MLNRASSVTSHAADIFTASTPPPARWTLRLRLIGAALPSLRFCLPLVAPGGRYHAESQPARRIPESAQSIGGRREHARVCLGLERACDDRRPDSPSTTNPALTNGRIRR
jgi:hypothetical protein